MLLQHTCSHVHSYTCFRLTRVHGSWPMVPLDGINGMVSAPLNLCASMYRAWIPGDWILRAAVKLRCVFVGPVHDCYTVKPANTQLQNTNITTLNNNKCKHAATKKNLNIIEPKNYKITCWCPATPPVNGRQKASICVNSCQLTTYDIQRTENKKVHWQMLAVHLFIFYFSLFFIFLKRSCFCVLLYTKKANETTAA